MARERKHPEYYAIKGYQILKKLTDEEVAKELGMAARTYREKIKGYYDFSVREGDSLSRILGAKKDDLFLT